MLVEIQALTVRLASGATPRRAAVGWDSGRLAMILAVLEARCGLSFATAEVYLNVAGGYRLTDPAADLAVAAALVSALSERPVPSEASCSAKSRCRAKIRPVAHAGLRLKEAAKLGFEQRLGAQGRQGRRPAARRVRQSAGAGRPDPWALIGFGGSATWPTSFRKADCAGRRQAVRYSNCGSFRAPQREEAHRRVRFEQQDSAVGGESEIEAEEVERHACAHPAEHLLHLRRERLSRSMSARSSATISGRGAMKRARSGLCTFQWSETYMCRRTGVAPDEEDAIFAVDAVATGEIHELGRHELSTRLERGDRIVDNLVERDSPAGVRADLPDDDGSHEFRRCGCFQRPSLDRRPAARSWGR